LQSMPPGKKRDRMTVEFERTLAEDLQNRIAVFDLVAAEHAAELMAYRKRNGNQVEIRDCIIAGIALATRATIATRNVSHFSDLSTPVVNPWTDCWLEDLSQAQVVQLVAALLNKHVPIAPDVALPCRLV